MTWLGLDIGGANIKVASSEGQSQSVPFRFWVEHQRLQVALTEIVSGFAGQGSVHVAATMTAELADCFESRKGGVEHIVDCLDEVCRGLDLSPPIYAGTDVVFRTVNEAKAEWLKTAASNWAMLAAYAGRYLPDSTGVVIDMGSTTTDIIPVAAGQVVSHGKTDLQRLQHGELVYVGVARTPVCSLVDSLILDGNQIPIAREFFATVGDAMLLCGHQDEDRGDTDTADGRPNTLEHAARRICKMICEDSDKIGLEQTTKFATQIVDRVATRFIEGIEMHSSKPTEILVTGSGVNFAKQTIEKALPKANVKTLGSFVDGSLNSVAPAFAVAVLASEGHRS